MDDVITFDPPEIVARIGICPTCQRWTYKTGGWLWRHGEDNTLGCTAVPTISAAR